MEKSSLWNSVLAHMGRRSFCPMRRNGGSNFNCQIALLAGQKLRAALEAMIYSKMHGICEGGYVELHNEVCGFVI